MCNLAASLVISMLRSLVLISALIPFCTFADTQQDTTNHLEEVTVHAYFSEQPLLRLTTSAGVIGQSTLTSQPGATLLPALNSVPGVRMEERSPGSYRLSLRGSLLR